MDRVQHIVQLANFYGPKSGGLRTALNHLGTGYVAAGYKVSLVVPGDVGAREELPNGVTRYTIPAPEVPGLSGYRAVVPRRVKHLLEAIKPDVLEVSDRLTLRGMGVWARRRGIPNVVISHERLDRLCEHIMMPPAMARRASDFANRRMARNFDMVVCTTAFAREEFDRIDVPNVCQVPLGVDLATFAPTNRDASLRRELAGSADALLVHCGRLSSEKHVERSVDTVAELTESGQKVKLVVAGDGPRRELLEQRAKGLPVDFLGFLDGRSEVARLLASADISLAPGPHETFGLAALEALASGTPVVVSKSSALKEIVQPSCGAAVDDVAPAFAGAVTHLLDRPEDVRRTAARSRAEEFTWTRAVSGMLDILAP